MDSGIELASEEGVRLQLRLPERPPLEMAGRVRWVRPWKSSEGAAGIGVELSNIGVATRCTVSQCLQSQSEQGAAARVPITVVEKHIVDASEGRIWVWANGPLMASESRQLSNRVVDWLHVLRQCALVAYIDAGQLRPCPDESLPAFRRWLARLGDRESLVTVLYASCPVTRLLMQRLACEAGIGESLVCFEREQEAVQYWEQLQEVGPLAAHGGGGL